MLEKLHILRLFPGPAPSKLIFLSKKNNFDFPMRMQQRKRQSLMCINTIQLETMPNKKNDLAEKYEGRMEVLKPRVVFLPMVARSSRNLFKRVSYMQPDFELDLAFQCALGAVGKPSDTTWGNMDKKLVLFIQIPNSIRSLFSYLADKTIQELF